MWTELTNGNTRCQKLHQILRNFLSKLLFSTKKTSPKFSGDARKMFRKSIFVFWQEELVATVAILCHRHFWTMQYQFPRQYLCRKLTARNILTLFSNLVTTAAKTTLQKKKTSLPHAFFNYRDGRFGSSLTLYIVLQKTVFRISTWRFHSVIP